MNQNILFRNINGKVTIVAEYNLSFDGFIESLKNRLERLYIKDDLLRSNITLDIRNIELDSKRILKIFDVLSLYGFIYIDKVIYKEKNSKSLLLHEGNIRAGEIKLFTNNALVIGNINKGSKVIVNGNLYVIGKVNGIVEFKGINNKLTASNIEDASIKICALERYIEGTKSNVLISIKENEIIEENFMDRSERIYGKSNSCYIW